MTWGLRDSENVSFCLWAASLLSFQGFGEHIASIFRVEVCTSQPQTKRDKMTGDRTK
jgi:hypothetical protein